MMCGKWVAAKKWLGCLSAVMALGLGHLMPPSFSGIMALLEAAGATAKICGRNHPPQKASICFFLVGRIGPADLGRGSCRFVECPATPKGSLR